MAERTGTYFVSDVHLGSLNGDPAEREERFVRFLKNIPRDSSKALYLLGDIWDFWYEYRDVVPKEGARVVAQLIDLMDNGVEVYFIPGNHDIWTYSFFEELGMKKVTQPYFTNISGKEFCIGHGDGLGGARAGYRFISAIFHCKALQWLFSTLHPWIAYRMGTGWSNSNRKSHGEYEYNPEKEPLTRWARSVSAGRKVDFFVFGHYHTKVDETLPEGARFIILDSWYSSSPYLFFDGSRIEECLSE